MNHNSPKNHQSAYSTEVTIMSKISIYFFTTLFVLVWVLVWMYVPVVQKSWETGYCVQVLSHDPSHNCENLPSRYIQEWTK